MKGFVRTLFREPPSVTRNEIWFAPYTMRSCFLHVLFGSFGCAKMTSEQPTGLFSPLQGSREWCCTGLICRAKFGAPGSFAARAVFAFIIAQERTDDKQNCAFMAVLYLFFLSYDGFPAKRTERMCACCIESARAARLSSVNAWKVRGGAKKSAAHA